MNGEVVSIKIKHGGVVDGVLVKWNQRWVLECHAKQACMYGLCRPIICAGQLFS
jgi:hypothetical protein